MYRAIYDDIDLTYFGIIYSIEKGLIPKRKYTTYDIEAIDGEIYSSSKYESFEVTVKLYIECDTEKDKKRKLRELIDLFNTKTPLPLELDKGKFTYAITNNEIQIDEGTKNAKVTINLICFDPYFYNIDNKNFDSEGNLLVINNEGGEKVLPFITTGFSKDTHFLQLEHQESGKRVLIGNYPQLTLANVKESTQILRDPCESTQRWVITQLNIDSDRTMGGTLAVTDSGKGICIGSLPSGSTTWKGVCARQNLSKGLDEFTIKCNMSHNSTGKNGDPTKPTFKDDVSSTTTEKKEYYYKVTSATLNYRSGPGTNYKKLGTLNKGFEIYGGTVTNDWLKFQYKNKTCYCSTKYLTKKVETTQVTIKEQNFVVVSATVLRSEPKVNSKAVVTIGEKEVVRCIYSTVYTDPDGSDRKYYKLAKKYKGQYSGYICTGNIAEASSVSFKYDEEEDYLWADNKMGMVEIYGFDSSGSELFKFGMYDDNEWYEYTYPMCKIGARTVLKDNTKIPTPQKNENITGSGDNYTISNSYYMSGKLGDWNEFWGTWTLSRKKVKDSYVWEVSVQKIKDGAVKKTLKITNIKYSDLPTEALSYIAVYMGTNKDLTNSSAVALTHLEVNELNPETESKENIAYFKEGDILDIDFAKGRTYINHEDRTDLIDVGSELFDIETGTNNIKIVSDDADAVVSAIIREKWIGSD